MAETKHSLRNGLLCVLAFLACALISRPFVEMGFMDDWSYIWSAREFARTGHFAYVWSSPILGWQIPWGALFIKLFGFSFIVVRLSALPIAMLTVFLFHAILVRFGATARNAILGTLTLALSPLFLPIAVSFMTDVPGLCSILLCIYLCQRAVAAQSDKRTVLWLLLAAVTNLLSGTVRQTSWLGLLVIIPSTAILLRKRRGVLLTTALSWLTGSIFILLCMHWFSRQPGALHEDVFHGKFKDAGHPSIYLSFQLLGSLLLILLLIYPLLVPWLAKLHQLGKTAWLRILTTATLLSLIQWKLNWMLPWIFYVIVLEFDGSQTGPVLGKDVLTVPLPVWLRIGIAALVIITAMVAIEYCYARRSEHGRQTVCAPVSHWCAILWIAGPYTLCYSLLLFPRGLYNFISDRYLLGLLPIAVIVLVMLYQQTIGPRLPMASFITVTILAFFSVAGTHDWFAAYRARLAAIHELRAAGMPRAQIEAGFEYDSWTQLEDASDGSHPLNLSLHSPSLGIPDFTPLGSPPNQKFTVIYADKPYLKSSPYRPVAYQAWLPPFRRLIRIERIR